MAKTSPDMNAGRRAKHSETTHAAGMEGLPRLGGGTPTVPDRGPATRRELDAAAVQRLRRRPTDTGSRPRLPGGPAGAADECGAGRAVGGVPAPHRARRSLRGPGT